MKKAFNLTVREWEWCRENPVSRVSMEREDNQRDRWLSIEEEAQLLQACAPWLHDLVIVALHTGMRMGEILELTWRGVDFSRRTVTVFHSKNGERRTIPINDTVLSVLRQKSTLRSLKTDVVFCSQAFTLMEAGHLRRSFRLAMNKALIEDFHFHDLRAYVRYEAGSSRRGHVQGPTAVRAQVADHDSALCASLPGKPQG